MSQGSLITKLEDTGDIIVNRKPRIHTITKPLSPERTKVILPYVLSIANKLHERGFVHRDLFVGNFLVTRKGTLLLTDFDRVKCFEKWKLLTFW